MGKNGVQIHFHHTNSKFDFSMMCSGNNHTTTSIILYDHLYLMTFLFVESPGCSESYWADACESML